MERLVVKKEIKLNATPRAVWDALTNPDKTKKYFYFSEVNSDWREGNPIKFTVKKNFEKQLEITGKILKIEPERLLQYTIEKEEESKTISTVTDLITYINGVTTLSITEDLGDDEEAEKRYLKSNKAWDKILDGLKNLVETKTYSR